MRRNPTNPPAPPLGNQHAAVDDPLDERDAFRCRASEKKLYAKAAKELGLRKSEFLRLAANDLAEKTLKQLFDKTGIV